MIRIKKSKAKPNIKVYNDDKFTIDGNKVTAAEKENIAAIKFYEKSQGRVNFNVYRNEELKDLLIEIFNGKCAYCETNIRRAAKGDVEHFRPKGRIETSDGTKLKPGYYWLAAEWNNLLLSCGNCNQKGRFRLDVNGKKILMGKGDLFPLSNEAKRIRKRNKKISGESRYVLLINPCRVDPNKYLSFNDKGEILAKATSGIANKRAEKSIEIYGLHRVELVKERKILSSELNILVMKIYNKLRHFEIETTMSQVTRDLIMKDLKSDVILLKNNFTISSEFLGIKKQKLRRILIEFPALRDKFLDYGIAIDKMQA